MYNITTEYGTFKIGDIVRLHIGETLSPMHGRTGIISLIEQMSSTFDTLITIRPSNRPDSISVSNYRVLPYRIRNIDPYLDNKRTQNE